MGVVDVDNFQLAIVCINAEALVLNDGIGQQEEACVEFFVMYGVVIEGNKLPPPRSPG